MTPVNLLPEGQIMAVHPLPSRYRMLTAGVAFPFPSSAKNTTFFARSIAGSPLYSVGVTSLGIQIHSLSRGTSDDSFSSARVYDLFLIKSDGSSLRKFRAAGGNGGTGGFGGSGSGSGPGGSSGSNGDDGYLSLLEKSPVLTKALTSAALTFIGDSISQLLIERVPAWNLKRTFLFTFLGMVLVGPTLHYWYLALSKMVSIPGGSGAFLRLMLDQFVFSPLFIGFFLSSLVTLEGRPAEVLPKLRQEWRSAVVANWQLWIPFQFLNFLYVPQNLQVLSANVIAVAWNVILSFQKCHFSIGYLELKVKAGHCHDLLFVANSR